ncbi:MAG: DUF6596 domain-containing protein [Paracoccaceae bacterium]
MQDAAPKAIAVGKAVDEIMRRDRGRLLAGLIVRLGDFQIAEDALQEAAIAALGHWGRSGLPRAPVAWLMKVGLNKGIDRLRAATRESRKADALGQVGLPDASVETPEDIPDERLRLIFACCHPALEEKSRVALTLRTVCNLSTREIAEAFLDAEATIGQRLSRAKAKIRAKGIAFAIPEPELWDARLGTVLSTIYLIFTTGYVRDEAGPRDLCREALFLIGVLQTLRPGDPEIEGARALMQLTEARRAARIDTSGATVPLEEQDRALWNHGLLAEARALLATAVARQRPGPYQIKAAIADCHMADPDPDWRQMSFLYQDALPHEPTPVVALELGRGLAELGHVDLALDRLDAARADLAGFQPWYAARASLLARLGRAEEAGAAYRQAIALAPTAASRLFLGRRLRGIEAASGPDIG